MSMLNNLSNGMSFEVRDGRKFYVISDSIFVQTGITAREPKMEFAGQILEFTSEYDKDMLHNDSRNRDIMVIYNHSGTAIFKRCETNNDDKLPGGDNRYKALYAKWKAFCMSHDKKCEWSRCELCEYDSYDHCEFKWLTDHYDTDKLIGGNDMPVTEKQRAYLRILSYLTGELCELGVETFEEADKILKEHKKELEEHITVKYYTDKDKEHSLIMEVYIDECYVFVIELYCKEKVKNTDTIYTVDVTSFGSYA